MHSRDAKGNKNCLILGCRKRRFWQVHRGIGTFSPD